jgi:hypothetical protein
MTGHERLEAMALADRAEADFPSSSLPLFLRSCLADGWDDAARESIEKIRGLYERRKRFAEQV